MARPQHIFLFDMARTRSHLAFRFLSTHPEVESLWHPYLGAALFGPERITQYTKDDTRADTAGEWVSPTGSDTFEEAGHTHVNAVKAAHENGKILVANEHCQFIQKQETVLPYIHDEPDVPYGPNPTYIPDELLATMTPVFITRNPVFSIPSCYKIFNASSAVPPGGLDWRLLTDTGLQRRLFDYFAEKLGHAPIVLDGDDVVWRTGEIGTSLSRALGLRHGELSEAWEPVPQEERHHHEVVRHILAVIDNSTGVVRLTESQPDTDVDQAKAMWIETFGQQVADEMAKTLDRNLPHYQHMAQFKI